MNPSPTAPKPNAAPVPTAREFFLPLFGRLIAFLTLRLKSSDEGHFPVLSTDRRTVLRGLYIRMVRTARAFDRLARLAEAGTLRVVGPRKSPAPRDPAAPPPKRRPKYDPIDPASHFDPWRTPPDFQGQPYVPLTPARGFGWMLRYVPPALREYLVERLTMPGVVAMIQTTPSIARLLRPVFRGLGVAQDGVFPPLPARKSRKRPKSEHKKRRPIVRPDNFVANDRQLRAAGVLVSPRERERRRQAAIAAETRRRAEEACALAPHSAAPAQGRAAAPARLETIPSGPATPAAPAAPAANIGPLPRAASPPKPVAAPHRAAPAPRPAPNILDRSALLSVPPDMVARAAACVANARALAARRDTLVAGAPPRERRRAKS